MSEWRDLPKGDIVAFAEAVKAGDEIEVSNVYGGWINWRPDTGWSKSWSVHARSKPKVRKIKILGWIDPNNGSTFTRIEDYEDYPVEKIRGLVRDPSQDREVEVPL